MTLGPKGLLSLWITQTYKYFTLEYVELDEAFGSCEIQLCQYGGQESAMFGQ